MRVTIQDILNVVNETMDAQDFSDGVKVLWIAEAEAAIIDEIISRYVGFKPEDYNIDYNENTERGTELLAPVPYSRIYEYYVKAQIDYSRHELELFQNDLTQYKGAMNDFWCHYNRTHKPIPISVEV